MPLSHEEATGNIDGGEECGNDPENDGDHTGIAVHLKETAYDNDPADRVGHTHQWSVQCCSDTPDDLPANKNRQDKDC